MFKIFSGAVEDSVWSMVMKARSLPMAIGQIGPPGPPAPGPVGEECLTETVSVPIPGMCMTWFLLNEPSHSIQACEQQHCNSHNTIENTKKGIPLHSLSNSLSFLWLMVLTSSWLLAKYHWASRARAELGFNYISWN